MRRYLFLIMLGVGGAYLFRMFCYEEIYLASDSMSPTLPQGKEVFVNKWTLFFREPRRGEIVMFESPLDDQKGLVKRVIALAGETLEVRNKIVYINGEILNESYVQYIRGDSILQGDNIKLMVIPKGCVFVMGDNRDVSGDSRDWKLPDGTWIPFINMADINGVIVL